MAHDILIFSHFPFHRKLSEKISHCQLSTSLMDSKRVQSHPKLKAPGELISLLCTKTGILGNFPLTENYAYIWHLILIHFLRLFIFIFIVTSLHIHPAKHKFFMLSFMIANTEKILHNTLDIYPSFVAHNNGEKWSLGRHSGKWIKNYHICLFCPYNTLRSH